MATSLSTCFHHTTTLTTASNHRNHRLKPSAASSSSANWWTPIFGVSPDPDYIHSPATATAGSAAGTAGSTAGNLDQDNCRSRFAPGCFTEEKAKQMRMKTVEMSSFHDIMYHSAIASRLASDVSGRYDR